jgi:hypothetical protein
MGGGGVATQPGSRPDPEVRTSFKRDPVQRQDSPSIPHLDRTRVKRDPVQRQKRPSIPHLVSTHLNCSLADISSVENRGGEGGEGGDGGVGWEGGTEGGGRRRVDCPSDHETWGACLSPLSPEVYIYTYTSTHTCPSPLYVGVCVCVCCLRRFMSIHTQAHILVPRPCM